MRSSRDSKLRKLEGAADKAERKAIWSRLLARMYACEAWEPYHEHVDGLERVEVELRMAEKVALARHFLGDELSESEVLKVSRLARLLDGRIQRRVTA